MNQDVQRVSSQINLKYDLMKAKREELRNLSRSIMNKNSDVYTELKKIKERLREEFNTVNPKRAVADKIQKTVNDLKDQLSSLKKKGYQGKFWDKEKLLKLISDKEEQFRNVTKTAIEEKAVMSEIRKMKSSIKISSQMTDLKTKLNQMRDTLTLKRKETKSNYVVIDSLKAKQKSLFAILDACKEQEPEVKEKKEEPVELDENGKPKKKKRDLTAEEQELVDQRTVIMEEINGLKQKRRDLR